MAIICFFSTTNEFYMSRDVLARYPKFRITLVVWKNKSEQLFEAAKQPIATV